jgi:hypothetical protein
MIDYTNILTVFMNNIILYLADSWCCRGLQQVLASIADVLGVEEFLFIIDN